MGIFGQARDLYRLQKQAKQIKKDLEGLHIEAEIKGVKVVINGQQEVVDVNISEEWLSAEKNKELNKLLVEVFNKAIKKAQEVAAERMRGIMGDMGMNLPGAEQ